MMFVAASLLHAVAAGGHSSILHDSSGLTFAEPFGDGMILQRGEGTRVWGTGAEPGKTVTVTVKVSGKKMASATATSDGDGAWKVSLPSMDAVWKSTVLASDGATSTEVLDVAFGDVLLCGGQSNMGYGMCGAQSATQTPQQALDSLPELRLFFQMGSGPHGGPGKVRCETSDGEDSATPKHTWLKTNASNAGGASAVCLLTAQRLYEEMGGQVPVGAVESCKGGTAVELWTPPTGELWLEHMAPLVPMSFHAVLWDQGEADAKGANATYYSKAFPALIQAWREAFALPRLPFVYVELPHELAEGFWMAQRVATQLPAVGFAVTADVDRNGLHPPDKQDVAARLSLEVRRLAYGEDVVARGPELLSASADGTQVALRFSNATLTVHAGILVGDDKSCRAAAGWNGMAMGSSKGESRNYTIKGDTVVITCSPSDSYVRINTDASECFLYGPAGLPAPSIQYPCPGSIDQIVI